MILSSMFIKYAEYSWKLKTLVATSLTKRVRLIWQLT